MNHIAFIQWDAQWIWPTTARACAGVTTCDSANRHNASGCCLIRWWATSRSRPLYLDWQWLPISTDSRCAGNWALFASPHIASPATTARLITRTLATISRGLLALAWLLAVKWLLTLSFACSLALPLLALA